MKELFPGQFHFCEDDLSFLTPLREKRRELSYKRVVRKKVAKKKKARKTKSEKLLKTLTPAQKELLGF